MEIEFSQNIYYSNKKKIPIAEVANALLALEEVSALTPILLERLFDDVTVQNMAIYVDELHSGSLKEKIKYYLNGSKFSESSNICNQLTTFNQTDHITAQNVIKTFLGGDIFFKRPRLNLSTCFRSGSFQNY